MTIRSAIEAMQAVPEAGEIVVCDNSDPKYRETAIELIPREYRRNGKVKVVTLDKPCFTKARHLAIEHANGEYIFCVDSHVQFGYNVLKDSIEFMDSRKFKGFGHPPVNWAGQGEGARRHSWKLDRTLKGAWGYRVDQAQKIEGKYMPWICNREWFLDINGYGCLADKHVSWGGAEMMLQHKAWMLGGENWAIPCRSIIHQGPHSKVPHENEPEDNPWDSFYNYRYRTYGPSGDYPVGIGWMVAYYVLGGMKAREYLLNNPHEINPKFSINVADHWDLSVVIGKEDREFIKQRQVMTLWDFAENKPWLN